MINHLNLTKALVNAANTVATAQSHTLVTQGKSYKPKPNDSFIAESLLFGDSSHLGVANDSSQMQRGIYQIDAYVPKCFEGSRFTALEMLSHYQTAFARGSEFTESGQTARAEKNSIAKTPSTKTHNRFTLSVTFSVIA